MPVWVRIYGHLCMKVFCSILSTREILLFRSINSKKVSLSFAQACIEMDVVADFEELSLNIEVHHLHSVDSF